MLSATFEYAHDGPHKSLFKARRCRCCLEGFRRGSRDCVEELRRQHAVLQLDAKRAREVDSLDCDMDALRWGKGEGGRRVSNLEEGERSAVFATHFQQCSFEGALALKATADVVVGHRRRSMYEREGL